MIQRYTSLHDSLSYVPVCRPLRLASFRSVTRARECTTAGFFIMRPSLYNLLIFRRELAKAISLLSFGSNHIFRRPHFNTDEANRFCNFKETEIMGRMNRSKNEKNKGSEQIYSLQRCMNENDREISVIWKQRHEKNAFPPKGTKGVRCLR